MFIANESKSSIKLQDILSRVSEADILAHYLNITKIPCVIQSPLRVDNNPSFGIYTKDGNKCYYKDFAMCESGGTFDLLCKMWKCSFTKCLEIINKDLPMFESTISPIKSSNTVSKKITYSESELFVKVRNWEDVDIRYWESYGISIEWLKLGDVYPVCQKIIVKDGKTSVFATDKQAYAYVEHKENKTTIKLYQPLCKDKRYKWYSKHDSSVVSLWTKVPEYGDKIVLCSSLKDALCLWSNTGIPALALQGEGYIMSNTAIAELKRRYKKIYILFDNDGPGIIDAVKCAERTGFINVILPQFNGGKDLSDYYKTLKDKNEFKKNILKLFV